MEESNSLNTSLSSVAQYASRLLMHSLDWDTNAVDYCLKERMAECVGDPPMPTPNVCRLLPSLEEENEAMIRRGCDHGKEMSNSAMEPLPLPLPPTNWSLPLEQEDIGRGGRFASPWIPREAAGAPGQVRPLPTGRARARTRRAVVRVLLLPPARGVRSSAAKPERCCGLFGQAREGFPPAAGQVWGAASGPPARPGRSTSRCRPNPGSCLRPPLPGAPQAAR